MTGYQIFLTDGTLLETINVKTADNQQFTSLVLLGQGLPNYGGIVATDLVWMLENFANTNPPVNPLRGQLFYGNGGGSWATAGGPFVYDGQNWENIQTINNSGEILLATPVSVDFTTVGVTEIFSAQNFNNPNRFKFIPTRLILMPASPISATSNPVFDLYINTPGDVLPNTTPVLSSSPTAGIVLGINGTVAFSTNSAPIYINITTGATGGLCTFQVNLFGYAVST